VLLTYADASDPTQFFGFLVNQFADVAPFVQGEWQPPVGAPNPVWRGIREKKSCSTLFELLGFNERSFGNLIIHS
jgi:hypothetical protein